MARSFRAPFTVAARWIGGLQCSRWCGVCGCIASVVVWIAYVLTLEPVVSSLRDRRQLAERLENTLRERDALNEKIQELRRGAIVAASLDSHRLSEPLIADDRVILLLTSEAQKAGVFVESVERSEQGREEAARRMMRLYVQGSFDSLHRFVFATYDMRAGIHLEEAFVTNRNWPILGDRLEARLSFGYHIQLPNLSQ